MTSYAASRPAFGVQIRTNIVHQSVRLSREHICENVKVKTLQMVPVMILRPSILLANLNTQNKNFVSIIGGNQWLLFTERRALFHQMVSLSPIIVRNAARIVSLRLLRTVVWTMGQQLRNCATINAETAASGFSTLMPCMAFNGNVPSCQPPHDRLQTFNPATEQGQCAITARL